MKKAPPGLFYNFLLLLQLAGQSCVADLCPVKLITLYLCLRETSLTRDELPYPSGGNRKQAASTTASTGTNIPEIYDRTTTTIRRG